ncbi:secretogranin-1 [Lissotriton helveticus]
MASPTLLLSLLLASLAAAHSVPLEKGEHPEELVTRCIVEVLSNALGKANAPPINPLCKEILKKSGQHEKVEKKSDGEDVQYEERHLTAPSDAEILQHMNGGEHHQNEEREKSSLGENEEKRHEEEEKQPVEEEKRHGLGKEFSKEEEDHDTGNYPSSKKRSEEINEDGNDEVHHHSAEKKHHEEDSEEIQTEHLDKRPHSEGKSKEVFSNEEEDDKRSAPHTPSDEWLQSSEKRSRGSEEESSEIHSQQIKRQGSHLSKEYEESDESKDMEKRYYKQRPYHRKPRHHQSTEDKRISHLEKGHRGEESEESDDEDAHYNNKKRYSSPNYDEWTYGNNHRPHNQEKRNSYESHSSEEVDKKRHQSMGSEEAWEKRSYSEERDEEKGYNSEENGEKRHHYEKKRQSYWELQPEYEEKRQQSRGNQENKYNYYAKLSPEMKRRYNEDQESTEDDESDRQYSKENKEEKRRFFVEENLGEEKRYYPVKLAEEQDIEKRYHSEEKKSHVEESEEEMKSPDRVRFKPYYNEDIDKRAVRQFNPYNKYLWWNNRGFEKRRNVGSQVTDSEDVNKHKIFLPDYNDYDLWDKRPLIQDMNPNYIEKRSPSIIHKFENKRQYNKMDELAQLLNYKKKSVELPELYNSEEGFKKRHVMQTKKRNLIQRPLTEEEEKELRNLAAMDLELQKIAEKLNDNRRG